MINGLTSFVQRTINERTYGTETASSRQQSPPATQAQSLDVVMLKGDKPGVSDATEVGQGRVEEVRRLVSRGLYIVSTSDLADAMIGDSTLSNGSTSSRDAGANDPTSGTLSWRA